MPKWIPGPIDHGSEIWETYPVQRIVVEASAEWEAREMVAETALRCHSRALGWTPQTIGTLVTATCQSRRFQTKGARYGRA
jgi:hypothetical protein